MNACLERPVRDWGVGDLRDLWNAVHPDAVVCELYTFDRISGRTDVDVSEKVTRRTFPIEFSVPRE